VARLAADLNTSSMRQLFQSIYPDRACQPHATAFIQVLIEESPIRRAPVRSVAPALAFHAVA
jgi:hypothetical protein